MLVGLFTSCKNGFISDMPVKIGVIEYNDKKVFIYKSLSNATVEESIQLRTSEDSLNSKRVFERYDDVVDFTVIDDSLKLILKDTSGYKVKVDTFNISISSLWN